MTPPDLTRHTVFIFTAARHHQQNLPPLISLLKLSVGPSPACPARPSKRYITVLLWAPFGLGGVVEVMCLFLRQQAGKREDVGGRGDEEKKDREKTKGRQDEQMEGDKRQQNRMKEGRKEERRVKWMTSTMDIRRNTQTEMTQRRKGGRQWKRRDDRGEKIKTFQLTDFKGPNK